MWAYPLTIEPDDNGTLLVSFVDIPEAHTFADNEDEITTRGTDCVLTALEGYMKDRRPIPAPSRELTGRAVVLPPLAAAKIELSKPCGMPACARQNWRDGCVGTCPRSIGC